jgi:cytochrome b561
MPEQMSGATVRQRKPSGFDDSFVHPPVARALHWLTVAFIVVLVPLGLAMTYRGGTLKLWDGTTNAMYSAHKLLGFLALMLAVVRVCYRFVKGRPHDERSLETWHVMGAYVVHTLLYILLIAVPLLGWIGVQRYPALTIFGLFDLPAFLKPSQEAAARAFLLHKYAGWALVALVAAHVAAALYHHLIRGDGVLRRMLPGVGRTR